MSEVLRIRKKPAELSAMQFTGGKENGEEIQKWLHEHGAASSWMGDSRRHVETNGKEGWGEKIYIRRASGTLQASVGDWVIHDVDGEFKPCSPTRFYSEYDRVDPAMPTIEDVLFGRLD